MPTINTQPNRLVFAQDPMMLEVETDKLTGAIPYESTEDNLSCELSIIEQTGNGPIKRVRLNASYSAYNKLATFDLSRIAESLVSLPLPPGSKLLSTNNDPPEEHDNAVAYLNAVAADKYGSPPQAEATVSSNEFFAVCGGSPYWNGFGDGTEDWYLLHSYKVQSHTSYKKVMIPTSLAQPQVLYFLANGAATPQLNVDVRFDDGTQDVVTKNLSLSPTNQVGVFSVYVGMYQLGLVDLQTTSGKKIISYDINVGNHKICYLVDDAPNDYEYYLLYSNGCGGMETARFSGRHKKSNSVERSTIVKNRWTGSTIKEGKYQSINNRSKVTLELNSGYHNKEYIQHLAQLVQNDVWLCDPARRKLYRYNVTSTMVPAMDDLEQKHNLTITIKQSMESPLNTFGV